MSEELEVVRTSAWTLRPASLTVSSHLRMPWQGDTNNMIDRFDVRAHLDHIPDYTPPLLTTMYVSCKAGLPRHTLDPEPCPLPPLAKSLTTTTHHPFSDAQGLGSHLLFNPTPPQSSPEQESDERKCNYERYRGLVQNDFAGSEWRGGVWGMGA